MRLQQLNQYYIAVLWSSLVWGTVAWGQQSGDPPATSATQPNDAAGIQPLERGPIHEAFADPGAPTRGEGMIAPKAPPPPVPEEPPESKPEGDNVRWVPGYWYWDAQRQDFIWVSGFWRNTPPDRVWEPGKWYEDNGQWVYRPGFWRPVSMTSWRVDLPPPPPSIEQGPSTPPPSDNAVWVPGYWEYRDGRYLWRAGYWAYANDVMVWHPPQYLCCGSTYLFVPGYWDYPLEWRGVLYTPIIFTRPLWLTSGWCWRPRLALSLGLGWGWGYGGLFSSLYIGPGWYYYYGAWGNPLGYAWWWYPTIYWPPLWNVGLGIGWWYTGWGCWPSYYYPWWCRRPGFWNPLWHHYCWLNRGLPNWRQQVQTAALISSLGGPNRAVSAVTGLVTAGGQPAAVNRSSLIGGTPRIAQAALTAVARQAAQQNLQLIQPAERVLRTLQANPIGRSANPTRPTVTTLPPTTSTSTSVPAVRPGDNPKRPEGTTNLGFPNSMVSPRPRPTVTSERPTQLPPPALRPSPPAISQSNNAQPTPAVIQPPSPSLPTLGNSNAVPARPPAPKPTSLAPAAGSPPPAQRPAIGQPSPPAQRPTLTQPSPWPSTGPARSVGPEPVARPIAPPTPLMGSPPALRPVLPGGPRSLPAGGMPRGGGIPGGARPIGGGPRR